MDEDDAELDELGECEVALPPEVLLHVRSEGGEHVVGVHEDVDEGVDDAQESGVSARDEADPDPGADGHHRVVVHVEEGYLPLLLAEDEEHGVEEFYEFADEVQVDALCHLEKVFCVV